jgi:hypothetical protein
MNQKLVSQSQPVSSVTPADIKPIVEHGDSHASIILAIAILLSMLFSGLTSLVYVILATKSPR